MKLVLDTNILFSFFRENPVRQAILKSELHSLELFSPEYTIEELRNNISKLSKYSGLNPEEIFFVLRKLARHVSFISEKEYKKFESQAKQLIHDKDIPIFALALKLNCAIWSNEPRFKKQSPVEIFNTRDLRKLLNI